MNIDSIIFKAYDIRGVYPSQLDEKSAYAIGAAYARFIKPKKVIIGRDVRLSGEKLMNAFIVGLQSENVEVTEITSFITTELIYFASGFYDFDGAVSVTASHNPGEYNGFKMCRQDAQTISGDTGIKDIAKLAANISVPDFIPERIKTKTIDVLPDYFNYLKDNFMVKPIGQFKIVADSNFGMQATILKDLMASAILPLEVTYINGEPDGSFPKGRPDPMIPSNRLEMAQTIKDVGVDFGVAWDADADRCFFYDELGNYIDPYYITALFIDDLLQNNPKAKILHDPRLKWLPIEIGEKYNNKVHFDKSGSAFMKQYMRDNDIDFAAEVTAHYFFKDFFKSDSGLIPLLWLLQILTEKKQPLSKLVEKHIEEHPKVNEMLYKVNSVSEVLEKLKEEYKDGQLETLDGISYSFENWRFNARGSNTEPLLKINIEALSKDTLVNESKKLEQFISELGGQKIEE
jgi:phosphomannomutase